MYSEREREKEKREKKKKKEMLKYYQAELTAHMSLVLPPRKSCIVYILHRALGGVHLWRRLQPRSLLYIRIHR